MNTDLIKKANIMSNAVPYEIIICDCWDPSLDELPHKKSYSL